MRTRVGNSRKSLRRRRIWRFNAELSRCSEDTGQILRTLDELNSKSSSNDPPPTGGVNRNRRQRADHESGEYLVGGRVL